MVTRSASKHQLRQLAGVLRQSVQARLGLVDGAFASRVSNTRAARRRACSGHPQIPTVILLVNRHKRSIRYSYCRTKGETNEEISRSCLGFYI